MRTIIFIFDIVLIMVFVCACTINVTVYCKTKHVRQLGLGILMYFYCVNAIIIFMSEFLVRIPFFQGTYNVLTYLGVKMICGVIISTLYLFLTVDVLEKKLGVFHAVVLLPLICVTVYVGDLNASVRQHWIFYTIRQIYLAGFSAYFFFTCAINREPEYRMRMKRYLPTFILAGVFAGMILIEDSLVIFHFQYVVNILHLKVFMEHNVSEDLFFVILAVKVIKGGFVQLIRMKEEQPLNETVQEATAVEVLEDLFVTKYALSNRQRDVLYLLLKDKTYQEMGNELGLSVGTVKFHAHGIYDKTDSKNRSQLILKYRKFYEDGRE
ncbi:helix-turn-helix transcriptional regulator [Lacrimispora algidixylanolytica]|uniref:HTH luxR-type domain-containing protein n=1 Tax=Lacrimispora algidixylanolytica TaxID=94868 RepID=A0A419TCS7_9FIRM|nr:helix-turn-helix transcriptional regulator [Lacrimispora algidixylanolytica]RKD35242.1 hypothetical protein BET01_02545 [Lacrimispora algidixylanolytica]